jgi:hypothetical protein
MCKDTGKRATTVCPDVVYKMYNYKDIPMAFCRRHTYTASFKVETVRPRDSGETHRPEADSGDHDHTETVRKPQATPMEPDEPEPVDTQPTAAPTGEDNHPTPIEVQPPAGPPATPDQPVPPPVAPPPAQPPAPPPATPDGPPPSAPRATPNGGDNL